MIHISSLDNSRVRRVLALQRSTRRRVREGLMIAEGVRLVGELLASSVAPVEMFVSVSFLAEGGGRDLLDKVARDASVVEVADEVMEAMSDTVTPQGILAVLPIPDFPAREAPRFALIPDQVRDPGNLGTMLRTAWAANLTEVLLPPGTVDPTNPKVVRAGMGAHFHLPIRAMEWRQIWERVGDGRVFLAEARRGSPYNVISWRGDVALVIGGEAAGAGTAARTGAKARPAAEYVHIPMAGGAESLNAAVAAGILLFEGARQRSASGS